MERRDADLTGIAVHLADRMLAVADGGGTVVSSVVPGLVAGSGIGFESTGRHDFNRRRRAGSLVGAPLA